MVKYTKFTENKEEFLNQLVKLLRMTSSAGHPAGNPLKEIRYVKKGYEEYARPVFEDGTGADGYYDVCISGDSNMGILYDMFKKFITRMW